MGGGGGVQFDTCPRVKKVGFESRFHLRKVSMFRMSAGDRFFDIIRAEGKNDLDNTLSRQQSQRQGIIALKYPKRKTRWN